MILMISAVFFVFIEGVSSVIISAHQLLWDSDAPELSQYDPTLGWTGVPNAFVPNHYGPDKYLRTNSRGFRNDDELDTQTPDGHVLIACSGDSFTYGQGVANNYSWCNYLTRLDPRLITANLAMPGYGVDQMLLRYERDAASLDHSVHIFAFIAADLRRMGSRQYHQYGRPTLSINEGTIVVENVPVPYLKWVLSRAISRAEFRVAGLAKRILNKLTPARDINPAPLEQVGPVALKLFQTVEQTDKEKNIVPVFVFLPTQRELRNDSEHYLWVVETMRRHRLPFIDLTPAIRELSASEVALFFIAPGARAEGHYTEAGNQWVATQVYARIAQLEGIKTLLPDISTGAVSSDSLPVANTGRPD
ncbi:MAG: hypothetical protein HKO55_01950 [Gammaproteobacteria bacterium]|nr:hypothetical protein [Gammaproteobacteria bacterium]